MSRADECKRLAAECLRIATAADTLPDFTGIFTALAQSWTNRAGGLKEDNPSWQHCAGPVAGRGARNL